MNSNAAIEHNVTVCGLPGSGKTTFIAALWHTVTEQMVPKGMRFNSLHNCDNKHLNEIAEKWRCAKPQIHTGILSMKNVTMNLTKENGVNIRLSIPDLSGESFSLMWEKRLCDRLTVSLLSATTGLLVFLNIDDIKKPVTITEEVRRRRDLGLPVPDVIRVNLWEPRYAPTQVQLVDILQSLQLKPLNAPLKRVAILLTAWDTLAKNDKRTPQEYLEEELPLLNQYLGNTKQFKIMIFGVSAQGGKLEDASHLTNFDVPSERIIVVDGENPLSHDLTTPISWLTENEAAS